MSDASGGHRELVTPEDIVAARDLDRAWTAPEIARAQRELADRELERWKRGEDVAPFTAYVAMLKAYAWEETPLLDIGCGAGYYASVLSSRGWCGTYCGLDFSEEMIRIANERETLLRSATSGLCSFQVGDARSVPYGDGSFPVVVSGCAMLHIATPFGWQKSLREATRVSSKWVMLHKTPLVSGPTRHYRKLAYGVECYEALFGEEEFRAEMAEAGLLWVGESVCSRMPDGRWISIMCRKAGA